MNLLEYLPEYLTEYAEVKALMGALQPEIDLLDEEREKCWDCQNFNTMPDEMIERWENVLGLLPPPEIAGEFSQHERRIFQLQFFSRLRRPYGIDTVGDFLALITSGHNDYSYDAATATLTIEVTGMPTGTNTAKFARYIKETVEEWLPAYVTVTVTVTAE